MYDTIRREFWWTVHNCFAHPVMQLLWFLSLFGVFQSLVRLGDWIHHSTVPVTIEEALRE